MALATEVTGDGKLISSDKFEELRQVEIITIDATEIALRRITTIREIREWYALTLEAAETYVDSAEQPENGAYSFTITLDARQMPSYTLRREFTQETVGPAIELDTVADPVFTPSGGSYGSWPLSVEISTETEGASIRYRTSVTAGAWTGWIEIDSGDSIEIAEPDPVEGTWVQAYGLMPFKQPSDIVTQIYERE